MPARLALSLTALLLPMAAPAAVLEWPVLVIPSACGGTLQACIDSAAPGDTIVIGSDDLAGGDGYTTIDESILITRSLTLVAAPGIDAVFGVDRYIRVNIAGTANASVSLADLTLRNGAIDIVMPAPLPTTCTAWSACACSRSDGSRWSAAPSTPALGALRPSASSVMRGVRSQRLPGVDA